MYVTLSLTIAVSEEIEAVMMKIVLIFMHKITVVELHFIIEQKKVTLSIRILELLQLQRPNPDNESPMRLRFSSIRFLPHTKFDVIRFT